MSELPRRPIPVKPKAVKAKRTEKTGDKTKKSNVIDEAADAVVRSFTRHTQGVEKGKGGYRLILRR